MRFECRGRSRPLLAIAVIVAVSGALGGCVTGNNADPTTTGSIPHVPPQGTSEEWTQRYQASPDDPNVALGFAEVLRRDGRAQQAVEVLQRAMVQNPKSTAIASAYGKALAEAGAFQEALKVVRDANSPRTPDWRLTSAEGAIQDQLGNPQEARRLYDDALRIAPDEPSILNNLGLSYLLTNELPKAEKVLRQAANSPRADGRVRQNLALVIGLQGRFDEATRVASQDLPPEQARANIAYLRSMLSQPNTWKQLKQTDRKPS